MSHPLSPWGGVTIYGRGPVALALYLFLHRQGCTASLPDLSASANAELPPGLSQRSIALSGGSWQLLTRICQLPQAGLIRQVDISSAGHGLHTRLDSNDCPGEALGHVVRYGALWNALHLATTRVPAPSRPADGAVTDALQVDADGTPGAHARTKVFAQCALTTELEVITDRQRENVRPAPATAYERFKPGGPIALLPLPEAGRFSLVWCDEPARIERLVQANEAEFSAKLALTLGEPFAAFKILTPRHQLALSRRVADPLQGPGRVAIGNAAQTLHPVAGQGLNLGLRDAFELARALGEGQASGRPLELTLKHYRRARRQDVGLAVGITDSLASLADQRLPGGFESGALVSAGMAALDLIAPLRRGLSRQFVFGRR